MMAKEPGEPLEETTHRYGDTWANGSGRWEFTIHEYVFQNFIAFGADFEEQRGIRWLVSRQIAMLVAERVDQGFTIISADGTSAYLQRL